MKRFRNLLMVYNEDPVHRPALTHVIDLAGQTGARLTVVDIVEDPHIEAPFRHGTLDISPLPDDLLNLRREETETALREMGANPATIELQILTDNPPIAIIHEVIRNGHDLVIKSAQGPDTGLGGRLFGSTAIKLMRKCPVPVWVLKPTPQIRFPKILAAVAPATPETGDNRLNDDILSLAAALARAEKGHLDVLHCWRLAGESLLASGRTRISEVARQKLWAHSEQQARHNLDAGLRSHHLEDIDHQVHLVRGHVGAILPTFIETQGIDLVVMGTLSKTGLAGLIAGSAAEKVFHTADCSVMAVKPPDFVSPVLLP